jgi:hypothetical protein
MSASQKAETPKTRMKMHAPMVMSHSGTPSRVFSVCMWDCTLWQPKRFPANAPERPVTPWGRAVARYIQDHHRILVRTFGYENHFTRYRLLKCSLCGASITIVSGCSRKRTDVRYGCSLHYNRGRGACKNNLLIARRALEEQLLAGLQAKVLRPDVVEYTLKRFEEELRRAANRRGDETAMLRRQEAAIGKKISNLTRALADGYSPAITADLSQLEEQLAEIRERASASWPEALQIRMRETRRFVESRLSDLRSLFAAEAVTIRAEIAKHVRKIILSPEGRSYVAAGNWDLLGVAAWMVPGARIELATPAFSGRRSTGELPRHGRDFQF